MRLLLLWLLAMPALAVDLKLVSGDDIGITDAIRPHVQACPDNRPAWLWGATGFHDSSGSYLYYTYHGQCGRSVLLKLADDGKYYEVPTPNLDGELTGTRNPNWVGVGWATEDRPLVGDFNGDGCIDIIQTGDETSGNSASAMTDGVCGVWTLKESWKTRHGGRDRPSDLNGDGILDYRVIKGSEGKTYFYDYISGADGFERNFQAQDFSSEPAEIQTLIAESDFRYLYVERFQYSDSCYVLSQGGSYQGRRWTRTICDGEIVDSGLPENGSVVAMLDLGTAYMAVQGSGDHGMYKLVGDSYIKDTAGDMPIVNGDVRRVPEDRGLEAGAYKHGFWDIDLDEDGDNDLIMLTHRQEMAYVLENDEGIFRLANRIQTVDGVGLDVQDLDGDGDLDLVIAGRGDARCNPRNCPRGSIYVNNLRAPSEDPAPDPVPTPDPEPEPTPNLKISELVDRAEANQEFIWTLESRLNAIGADLDYAKEKSEELLDQIEELKTAEPVEPAPDPNEPTLGMIPYPHYDPESNAWARFEPEFATDFALIGDCERAISGADWAVNNANVSGNQYLNAARIYTNVFTTLSWCDVPADQAAEWVEWGEYHLGEPDGSVGNRGNAIWWGVNTDGPKRWSVDNAANNYYHSFVTATSVYAMAANDEKWLNFLREDRLPRMYEYYSQTPEGGSKEGTGYGESHRAVMEIARLWRLYDGTEVLPQEFIDNTVYFWIHATTPSLKNVALFGEQTRAKGRVDGYHCDIIDNTLPLVSDPQVIQAGKWIAGEWGCNNATGIFQRLVLSDYPKTERPELPLVYHAEGTGVFFARQGWGPGDAYLYCTAGRRREAHQCEDQGGCALWDNGWWRLIPNHIDGDGLCFGDVSSQNVLNFGRPNIRGSISTLEYSVDDDLIEIDMDLSPAVGELWKRSVIWDRSADSLLIDDEFTGNPVFQAFTNGATVTTEETDSGFSSVVAW